jgi:tetratricopeptide (TPR) repeat protein
MSVINRITKLGIAFAFCFLLNPLCAQTTDAIDSLNHLVSVAKDPVSKVGALLVLASEIEGSDQKKALDYAQQAYLLSKQSGNKKGEINSQIQKGNCYFRISEYRQAMECAENSMSLAEDLKMDKEKALSLNIIGRVYGGLGENERSSEYFFKSLKIFEKINDKAGMAQSLGFIGIIYYTLKNYTKSLEYLNKSLLISKVLNDSQLIRKQLNNIATVYLDLKKYNSSLFYSNEALKINMKLDDKLNIGINYINIGYAQSQLKRYDEALVSFQKALELGKEIDSRFYTANCYVYMGQYYYETENKSSSIKAFKTALYEAQKNGFANIVYLAAEKLGNLYLERKDTISAFKYKIIENQSEDSLNKLRKDTNMSNLEFQYQAEKKELELKIAQQKKESLMIIIILALFASLIITLLVISRQRIKVKHAALEKQTSEKELSYKNKELSINLMALMKKHEMLSDISDRLIQIEKEAVREETKQAIFKISHELRIGADEKIMKEFSVRFQEVHNGFYEKLLEKFPELTQTELKLCAFLRLNMSTKDISELTGQSNLAVEKSRYRLRNKLGIRNSESNLVTFLLQF